MIVTTRIYLFLGGGKGGGGGEKPVDVSRLDMRVGKILSVKLHPDADTLYVEESKNYNKIIYN